MSEAQSIQWFPGHMAKTRRKIKEILPLIDAVAEVVDARVPVSSRNPELLSLIGDKPLIILLNKCDMADPNATAGWINYYKKRNITAIGIDCKNGKGLNAFKNAVKTALADKLKAYREKGMVGKPLRVMVVGIPNVGKSSFINRIGGGNKAKVENRPGVTRGNQWFTVDKQLELLDTPGVLWPKFEDELVGLKLALTGAIKDQLLPMDEVTIFGLNYFKTYYPERLEERFKGIDLEEEAPEIIMEMTRKLGFREDYDRFYNLFVKEVRDGKLGRYTLDIVGVDTDGDN